jgi:hypothetical protein
MCVRADTGGLLRHAIARTVVAQLICFQLSTIGGPGASLFRATVQPLEAGETKRGTGRNTGGIMEMMLQGLVIIGGLTFSLAASLLIEELIFGRIVRLAFVRRTSPHRAGSELPRKS